MYHQMVKEDLISLDKNNFVDRIGQGHFVFDYFRETKFIDEVKEAIELKVLEQAKFHYREDTKEDKSDYLLLRNYIMWQSGPIRVSKIRSISS